MTAHRKWTDTRARRTDITPEHRARAAANREAFVGGYELAQIRKALNRTQHDVAGSMGISQARVSGIEHGDLDRVQIDTLARYVAALGGSVSLVVQFGDRDPITIGASPEPATADEPIAATG